MTPRRYFYGWNTSTVLVRLKHLDSTRKDETPRPYFKIFKGTRKDELPRGSQKTSQLDELCDVTGRKTRKDFILHLASIAKQPPAAPCTNKVSSPFKNQLWKK